MRRVNANLLLFAFVMVFILSGIRGDCFNSLTSGIGDFSASAWHLDLAGVRKAEKAIEKAVNDGLYYHDLLMDIDSVRNNLLGTRVVIKEDTTVVKSDSGSLIDPVRRLEDSEIEELVERIEELKDFSEANGVPFLYCFAPLKQMYETAPDNVENYAADNVNRLLEGLRESRIPVVDLAASLEESVTDPSDLFYRTDHHWTIRSGFLANAIICSELSSLYGFRYDKQYTDIANYRIVNYPHWFLGSRGKKVGTWFTWQGADDFELIIPDFETSMSEERPLENEFREGAFEDTVLFRKRLEKDLYGSNTYAAYSGGDYRLQIMRNRLNPAGDRILLIRDSFACAVAPFLALQTGELHICDMRNFKYYAGDKFYMDEYIRKINPDYVLVLYSDVTPISESLGKYDFLSDSMESE